MLAVVPTHVGVNRKLTQPERQVPYRCPHACGGEPVIPFTLLSMKMLSPRMWG